MIRTIVTRKQYKAILLKAIAQTEAYIQQLPEVPIYKGILKQLLYIKSIVIDQDRALTKSEIIPLTLGAISVKNFDDDDDYGNLLSDAYGTMLYYQELPAV